MTHEWLLKRNCSMTPRQVAKAYGVLFTFVLVVSLAFALHGIWIVFAFAVLEITVVVTALLYYARHALDQERVFLSADCLRIERIEAGRVQHFTLDPYWTRIAVPQKRRQLIALESRGVKVELGSFVSEPVRRMVAQELQASLRGANFS